VTLPPLSPNAWMRWDLVSRLLPPGAHDVLEVGCGQGGFAARLATRYPSYTAVELDEIAYEVARARLDAAGGGGEVHNGDLSVLPDDQKFDLVCAFEVIEHIEDDRKALTEWAERLRPGGWMVLSTPAFQRRFASADTMAGHFRRYDPPVMTQLLHDIGLHHVQVQQFGGPLGYVLEAGRNYVGRRRASADAASSKAELTSGSGRLLQPNSGLQGAVTQYGTLPFRMLQRIVPGHGPGLVAKAQMPEPGSEPA
jgi:SAM-dependent methyltransferase